MGFHYRVFLLRLCVLTFIGFDIGESANCSDNGSITVNSTYGRNRDLALSSLASNTLVNGGFYNTTVGKDPNKVYALALCRGDFSLENCSSCINSTIQDLITDCPSQKEAIFMGDCKIRYANRNIFGILELFPSYEFHNKDDLPTNFTQFDQIWGSLMDGLVRNASAGTSRLKFATGETKLTPFQTIYALAQCTPGLSQSDCDLCLRQSAQFFQRCCRGQQGGGAQNPSCFFRWELYPFYMSLPSPPTAYGNGQRSWVIIVAIVVPVGVSILLFIAVYCLLTRRGRKKYDIVQENNAVAHITTIESL